MNFNFNKYSKKVKNQINQCMIFISMLLSLAMVWEMCWEPFVLLQQISGNIFEKLILLAQSQRSID